MTVKQTPKPIVSISEADFESVVLRADEPVLVAFCTPWSSACQILDHTLSEVAISSSGRARVVKIDADDNPELGLWYEIQSVPTMILFVGGAPRARIVGTASRKAILARLSMATSAGHPPPPLPDNT